MTDALNEAQRLYQEALEASRDQRTQIAEDLRFSDPSDPQQWDEVVKRQRETDPGGKRPCLVMDQTGQYVANVAGQIEQQTPSLHAIPVGGAADKQAAEQIDGRFRHIEYASRATQHYTRVLTSAARTGVGHLIVRPEYIDRALGWQEPRISSEADPLRVVFDPWSVETDGSDASFGYLLTPLSMREFERRYKGKDAHDFGDLEYTKRDDKRKSVMLAEQWFEQQTTVNVIVYTDEMGQEQASTEDEYWAACQAAGVQFPVERTYKDKRTTVKWRRMSGCDVLEESDYPADSIGIIPVYGYVGFSDGRMRYCGIPRRARAPQQAYNYHISELMMPGAQLLASKRALAGLETIWDKAAVQRRAFLPFNDIDEEGPVAPPSMIKVGSSLVDHAASAERALHDIQAALGMYQATLGAPSNETSGVAIESRKQQGEASNAHFPSHLAASLGQLGRVVLQMDARLADTQRKAPIMGVDGTPGSVVFNPEQKQAFQRQDGGAVSINPSVGTYGVRVVVGASYSTQRTQTNAAFAEIMRGNKELAPVVAPFWAQTLDFPGSDKFAQAMAAMAPAPVKAILQPEGADKGTDPAAMAQQLKQCQDALQEAIQHAKDAQNDADQAIEAAAEAKRSAESKVRELDIKAYEAETDRFKVTGANEQQIQAIVSDLINQMLSQPDPLPGDPQPEPQEQPEPEMPGDGQGPDNTPMHEQAEAPAFEQSESTSEPGEMGEGMQQ
jgi:hypothetical protein